MTTKRREPPLKIDMAFDHAIESALKVAPPEGGWKALDMGLKSERKPAGAKKAKKAASTKR